MPKESQRRLYNLAILLVLLIAGLTLLSFPTPGEETLGQPYRANLFIAVIDAVIGYAPPGYFTSAHITAGNDVTVTLTLVETNTVIFSSLFPAGTFDIPKTSVRNGGNIFLTIESKNNVFTQMNLEARIFHDIVAYPYSWIGLTVLGFAGLFTLAALLRHTTAGKIAGKILPVEKAGLA